MSFHVLLANVEKFSFVNSAACTYAKVKRADEARLAGSWRGQGIRGPCRAQDCVSSWEISWLGGTTRGETYRFKQQEDSGGACTGARNDHVSSAIAGYLGLTGVQLRRDICAVEAAELNICSWDSMNVSAGPPPPALSLSTSVGRQNRSCILQLHCPSVCDWPVY